MIAEIFTYGIFENTPYINPCPICRRKDKLFLCRTTRDPSPNAYHMVVCNRCSNIGPWKKTKETALDAWNGRKTLRIINENLEIAKQDIIWQSGPYGRRDPEKSPWNMSN